ncbi:MAG: hypothetical protein ACYTF0_01840 [Planctomycetota bacterium]|jgi:hypothetical protein
MRNTHSAGYIGSPARGLFGLTLPAGVDTSDIHYFRRCGVTYQLHGADNMGIGPLLRLLPVLTMIIAAAVVTLIAYSLNQWGSEMSTSERIATFGVGILILALVFGTSRLMKDMTKAAVIDTKRRILWLGGGWMNRWDATPFDLLAQVEVRRIAEDGAAEFPWSVEVVDLNRERLSVSTEMTEELAGRVAKELAKRLCLPIRPN